MKKLVMIAAAAVILVLAAVALGGAVTSAQGDEGPLQTFLARVAEKLGISEEELTTAMKEARLEMIDEAVAEGRLSEEQADRLRERVEAGAILPLRPPAHHPRPGTCQRAVNFGLEAAAQVLGMEKGQLIQEIRSGKSLAEVAEAQGMTVEEFKEAFLSQIETQLDELVAQGKLSGEQAERILQRVEENIDRIVNGHMRPGGPCPPGHRPGGPGPRPPFTPPFPPPPPPEGE